MTRRRRRAAIIFLTVLVAGAICLWRFWPRERLLTEVAVKVADASHWIQPHNDRLSMWRIYDYQPGNRLVFLVSDKDGYYQFRQLNLRTGTEEPLTGLLVVIKRESHSDFVSRLQLSPDGTKVVWHSKTAWNGANSQRPDDILAANLDGSGFFKISGLQNHDGTQQGLIWLPEKDNFVVVTYPPPDYSKYGLPKSTAHRTRRLQKTELRTVHNPQQSLIAWNAENPLWDQQAYTYLANKQIFVMKPDTLFYPLSAWQLIITDFDGAKTLRSGRLTIPSGERWESVTPTPDGSRLAWVAKVPRPNPARAFLRRFLPRVQPRQEYDNVLYVCDLDGSSKRQIGRVPLEIQSNGGWNESSQIRGLQWMADDRHIAFLYQNALWTVPVE